ncbi:uncharacterized protein [Dysidea avara]|uniref:uncharacterized protein n=1 Tax=Dysidea avara TaxID=196820 RepID=UPI003330CA9A
MLMNAHGVNGTLYRTGEHILLKNDGEDSVVKAIEYFAIYNSGQHYTLVKGNVYQLDGHVHSYSGSSIVLPTTINKVFPASSVLRKVMLYPNSVDTPESFVLIDHLRPTPPICVDDVIVPVYPEEGDMLNVRGETDEIWFAHVLSSDESVKTSKVHFYVEDPRVSNKYIRESIGRMSVETIHWDSIIQIASGQWHGTSWLKL